MSEEHIANGWAAATARQLLDNGEPVPEGLSPDQRQTLAWALKDVALACWSSDQSRVPVIADLLQQLLTGQGDPPAAPVVAPLARWVEGLAHITQGRMTDANASLLAAAEGFTRLDEAAAAAQTQIPRIMVLCMLGELDLALQCGLEAREALLARGEVQAASRVDLNLGQLLCERSDFATAQTHFRAAAAGFAATGDPQRALQSRIGLADALAGQGEFAQALAIYASTEQEALSERWPVLEVLSTESAALIHLACGRFGQALAGLERSRRRYEALQMRQHLANAERQLGDAYLELRLLPEAKAVFSEAIAHYDALEMRLEEAWARVQLARTLRLQSAPDGEVDALLAAAQSLFSGEQLRAGQATVLLAQAEAALASAARGEAHRLGTEAQSIFESMAMPADACRAAALVVECESGELDAPDQQARVLALRAEARRLGLTAVEVQLSTRLGLYAAKRGDAVVARECFTAAIERLEAQRGGLAGDDLRSALLANHLTPYRELLRIALDLPEPSPCEVLLALERFRARALADRLGGAAGQSSSSDPQSHALRDRMAWLQRRANRLRDEGEDVSALERDIHLLEAQWQESTRRQRVVASGDETSGSQIANDVAAWQRRLPPGAAIVEYGVLDDEVFACVLTDSQIVVQRNICSWAAALAALDRVDIQFDSMRLGNILPERHISQLTTRAQIVLRQLHALIWAPLSHCLKGIHQVAVVPHGRLGNLQFATLFDGEAYLGEQLLLVTAPSAATVAHCLSAAPATLNHALVLADSERLQHAKAEAATLAARISGCTSLIGSEATAAALRQHAPAAQLIHLACHGVFRSDNPVFSALELADGNFAATDVERLRLSGAIVVLSACESGSASIAEGDEVFGLVRAWLIAGAARVVASRWPVGDAVAAEWMNHFYDELLAGATPAAATRLAQSRVRSSFPHPAQWGAFSLFGAW